jgi:hypothetical protein
MQIRNPCVEKKMFMAVMIMEFNWGALKINETTFVEHKIK